jgi:nitrogen fixation protein FixH
VNGRLWPLALALVLALTVVANVAMWIVAADPNGSAVEPDYYRKALAWDRVQAQQRANAGLGWTVRPRFAFGAGSGSPSVLEATVLDAEGRPLEGARVSVTAIHNALAGSPIVLLLAPEQPGVYAGRADFPRAGLWELRFLVTRGGRSFTADLRADAPPARPSASPAAKDARS